MHIYSMRKAIFRPSYSLHKMEDFGPKITKYCNKNDLLFALRDFKNTFLVYVHMIYEKSKPKTLPIFHFDRVNNGWFLHLFYVKPSLPFNPKIPGGKPGSFRVEHIPLCWVIGTHKLTKLITFARHIFTFQYFYNPYIGINFVVLRREMFMFFEKW